MVYNVSASRSRSTQASAAHTAEETADLPDLCCCPITRQLLQTPVSLAQTQQTYSALALLEWVQACQTQGRAVTCPTTGLSLTNTMCFENLFARQAVAHFCEQHGLDPPARQEKAFEALCAALQKPAAAPVRRREAPEAPIDAAASGSRSHGGGNHRYAEVLPNSHASGALRAPTRRRRTQQDGVQQHHEMIRSERQANASHVDELRALFGGAPDQSDLSTYLNFTHHRLREDPGLQGSPSRIIEVTFAYNGLTQMPTWLARCHNMTSLNLLHNQIANIDAVVEMRALVYLNASHNKLTSLPTRLGQLSKLKRLQVASNRLSEFPASMAQLTDLEELDVSNNPLQGIPKQWVALTRLRHLDIRNIDLRHRLEPALLLRATTNLTILGATHVNLRAMWKNFVHDPSSP